MATAITPIPMLTMQTTLTATMTTTMKITKLTTTTMMTTLTIIEEGTHRQLATAQTAVGSKILAKCHGPTEGRTDTSEYRDARTHLKMKNVSTSVASEIPLDKTHVHKNAIFLVFSIFLGFFFDAGRKKFFLEDLQYFPLFWLFYLPIKRYSNANGNKTARKAAFYCNTVPRP